MEQISKRVGELATQTLVVSSFHRKREKVQRPRYVPRELRKQERLEYWSCVRRRGKRDGEGEGEDPGRIVGFQKVVGVPKIRSYGRPCQRSDLPIYKNYSGLYLYALICDICFSYSDSKSLSLIHSIVVTFFFLFVSSSQSQSFCLFQTLIFSSGLPEKVSCFWSWLF